MEERMNASNNVQSFPIRNDLLSMAETCSLIANENEPKSIEPNMLFIEKEKWNKLKDMFSNLQNGLELMQLRHGSNADFALLHKKATEIANYMGTHDKTLTTTKITKPPTMSPPPLQRPHFSLQKRKTDESNSESNSEDDTFKKRSKSRRQRAKAAPSEELYCRSCGETKTCEWRRGPDGYKSLCNACGIHYAKIVKKEESALHSYKPKNLKMDMLLNTQPNQTEKESSVPTFSQPSSFNSPVTGSQKRVQQQKLDISPAWNQITTY